jgi:hypothetical protein
MSTSTTPGDAAVAAGAEAVALVERRRRSGWVCGRRRQRCGRRKAREAAAAAIVGRRKRKYSRPCAGDRDKSLDGSHKNTGYEKYSFRPPLQQIKSNGIVKY